MRHGPGSPGLHSFVQQHLCGTRWACDLRSAWASRRAHDSPSGAAGGRHSNAGPRGRSPKFAKTEEQRQRHREERRQAQNVEGTTGWMRQAGTVPRAGWSQAKGPVWPPRLRRAPPGTCSHVLPQPPVCDSTGGPSPLKACQTFQGRGQDTRKEKSTFHSGLVCFQTYNVILKFRTARQSGNGFHIYQKGAWVLKS